MSSRSETEARAPAVGGALSLSTTSTFIDVFDPSRASPGFTLILYRRRVPVLIDMNGNAVHAWLKVRAIDRIRLAPDGDLLTIGMDRVVREYDWHGEQIWEYLPEDTEDFPHHDLIRLANGNVLLLYRSLAEKTDYLLEVTPGKEIAWQWSSRHHLAIFERGTVQEDDPTHINSIQEIPANRLFDAGDTRFRPGNILASARHLNTIFVIDKESDEVTWQFHERLDWQHEARMIEPGFPNSGNILIFNNNANGVYRTLQSEILELDPTATPRIVWSFGPKYFFTSTGGLQQALPNGNLLIHSARGGRMFEVDRSGRLVWQWRPPGLHVRAHRYPYDFCPQFELLLPPVEEAIALRRAGPFVSRELFTFKWQKPGEKKRLLRARKICRPLIIPPSAWVELRYGVHRSELAAATGVDEFLAEFTANLTRARTGDEVLLVEDMVTSHQGPPWRELKIPLAEYAYQAVFLCLRVSTRGIPESSVGLAAWEIPVIENRGRSPVRQTDVNDESKEVKEVLEQRLKSLGYVE